MSWARWLSATVVVVAVGCSESSDGMQGSLSNAERGVWSPPGSLATDPPVMLVDTDAGTIVTRSAAGSGAEEPPVTPPPIVTPPSAQPDAGPSQEPPVDDDGESDEADEPDAEGSDTSGPGNNNGNSGNGNAGMSGEEPEPEPEPPPQNDGGLVGTVCDLLGGLLCPVGLLCVDGLCQEPAS